MSFGLYVHWPWCESKCPYCDFNSHVAERIDADRWIRAYRAEIRRVAETSGDEVLSTIFFGGGTPSLMPPAVVDAVIDEARKAWRGTNDIEISMEANPGSVDAARFQGYRSAGVNRVSLGIQSLDDQHLRLLGRKHGVDEALRAIDVAMATFDRVNIDLIYARQHQTQDDWRAELQRAIAIGTHHMSLYQLTIEDGTVFGRRHEAGQLRGLPDEDRSVDMYVMTNEICEAAGMPAYEISNHARPGQECRHNLIYWQGGQYAAVGPGAHGRVGRGNARRATEAIRDPGAWLKAVDAGSGESLSQPLNAIERLEETILMGLRLSSGLDLARLRVDGANPDAPWTSLDTMIEDGFLKRDGDLLKTTMPGRLLLNTIVAELAADLPMDGSLAD